MEGIGRGLIWGAVPPSRQLEPIAIVHITPMQSHPLLILSNNPRSKKRKSCISKEWGILWYGFLKFVLLDLFFLLIVFSFINKCL
jgi:hypothetical protein